MHAEHDEGHAEEGDDEANVRLIVVDDERSERGRVAAVRVQFVVLIVHDRGEHGRAQEHHQALHSLHSRESGTSCKYRKIRVTVSYQAV